MEYQVFLLQLQHLHAQKYAPHDHTLDKYIGSCFLSSPKLEYAKSQTYLVLYVRQLEQHPGVLKPQSRQLALFFGKV